MLKVDPLTRVLFSILYEILLFKLRKGNLLCLGFAFTFQSLLFKFLLIIFVSCQKVLVFDVYKVKIDGLI